MALIKLKNYSFKTNSEIAKIFRCYIIFLIISMFLKIYANPNPKAIDLWGASSTQLKEHNLNYCNNTELITKAGLLNSPLGQFLGFPCSNEFFHCRWQSDGYRTYLKNCRTGINFRLTIEIKKLYILNFRTCL